MLITFRCKSYANVTMFGDIGLQLIKMMGHSGTVPGAILAPDIPEALSKLTFSLAAESTAAQKDTSATGDVEDEALSEQVVSLNLRAAPLVELLKSAIDAKCDVMWDTP
ncbi:DUF1840 domain-containing protein [Vibrio parahaemolyticus]|uniref:DUF1840 domain-containing protein n=1 Tax=Vibrio harveyi group TaxID=717610 RepID=UPI0006A5DDF1|nr:MULTISPECIES: DUF1840 domain-containing protein [Vibrio harveyi group]EGR1981399.1 DUF1840 domain-containing protein [Vibrio parahaemolyticus]EHR5762459.1 DUF1840 domain-containing protein [Vibrio parahaemolyticus]EJG1082635.1 DUF1840 domain-containing protein [Vibrio parahaemolyticus]EJG1181204.1 DUF1840 domain-containing protein [Vibrio parahaemolyticus]EJG1630802.1 DUF1840 domain-containing protein [Vibrio parahaemolyticus]